ncbi:MAG: NnrS family protein [Burkholderiales bacterium]|nr:NnrS family protein [Burkholderiales bacterium]
MPNPQEACEPPDWRAERLLAAPHRLAFFVAALGLAGSALWWLAALLLSLPWAVAPSLAHGLLFAGGFMPAFIAGFLYTAGPRWLGMPELDARQLLAPLLLFGAGWVQALVAFHVSSLWAALALLQVAMAWGWLLLRFVPLLRASRVPDRLHALGVVVAGFLGLTALLAAALGLQREDPLLLRAAVHALLWLWLAPTFVIVSHRMLPFFSAAVLPGLEVWRPYTVLVGLLVLLVLTGAVELTPLMGWSLPAGVEWLAAALLFAGGLGLLGLAWRWGLARSLRGVGLRLLAMLHVGFVWLGLTALLAAVAAAWRASGGTGLGLAPLHAMTLGYLGSTLVAMATRVVTGHSGRPLAVDAWAWRGFLLLQAGVLLRLAAALNLLPAWPSGLVWALVASAWAWRHGLWLGQPRADGRPG